MKIKTLINELLHYNSGADVSVIAHGKKFDFTITWSGPEGTQKNETDEVNFYVDALCTSEKSNSYELLPEFDTPYDEQLSN